MHEDGDCKKQLTARNVQFYGNKGTNKHKKFKEGVESMD